MFFQSIFGSREVKALIRQLKTSDNVHTIIQETGYSYSGSNVQARSLVDYEENALKTLPPVPGPDATPEEIRIFNEIQAEYVNNKPNKHRDGTGDGSYITLNYKGGGTEEERKALALKEGPYKRNKTTTLFHEYDHAGRVDTGTIKAEMKDEEIEATQFINRNFRNDKNRRERYGEWIVPKEND